MFESHRGCSSNEGGKYLAFGQILMILPEDDEAVDTASASSIGRMVCNAGNVPVVGMFKQDRVCAYTPGLTFFFFFFFF